MRFKLFVILAMALVVSAGCAIPVQPATGNVTVADTASEPTATTVLSSAEPADGEKAAAMPTLAPIDQVQAQPTAELKYMVKDVEAQPNVIKTMGCPEFIQGWLDDGSVVEVPLQWRDGQCIFRSEARVYIPQLPSGLKWESASGVYEPCQEAGWHRGLSGFAADPSVDVVPSGSPFINYTSPACSVQAGLDQLPQGAGQQPKGCFADVNGFTKSEIEGGFQFNSDTPRNFPLADGCWALYGDPRGRTQQAHGPQTIEGVTSLSVYRSE